MTIQYWKHAHITTRLLFKGHNAVVTTGLIKAAEMIFQYKSPIVQTPTKYTLQIDENAHIDSLPEHEWRYMNHSCTPNVKITDTMLDASKTIGKFSVVALRDINQGEELTFDYNTTEYEMASPFECNCATPNCTHIIRGYKHLPPEEKKRIEAYTSQYVLKMDKENV